MLILCVVPLAVLTACSSTPEVATGNSSSTTTPKSSTTAAKVQTPECKAVGTFRLSEAYAKKAVGAPADKQATVVNGLEKSAENLKKAVPQLAKNTDIRVAYWKATLAATTPPGTEPDDAKKAENEINFYYTTTCNPSTSGAAKNGGGGKPASSTTTAAP